MNTIQWKAGDEARVKRTHPGLGADQRVRVLQVKNGGEIAVVEDSAKKQHTIFAHFLSKLDPVGEVAQLAPKPNQPT